MRRHSGRKIKALNLRRRQKMSAEVKSVSEVVRSTVQEVKEVAIKVSESLRMRRDEAKQALDMVSMFGDDLGKATAELRSLLGGATNNPPPEEDKDKKKGWLA